jgi:hypothetical protein
MSQNVRLYVSLNGSSIRALSIPVVKCTTFSTRPLKWLRFLGYAIYGAQGRIVTAHQIAPRMHRI